MITRLAPSPTGALHLGNARTFVINWVLARQKGWRIVLRIDDLDGPRIKKGADQEAMDILSWLGLDWDEGPYYQSERVKEYHDCLTALAQQGQIYPCLCTRTQIQSAAHTNQRDSDDQSLSAPHSSEPRYPGTCRPSVLTPAIYDPASSISWRLSVPEGPITFNDQVFGPRTYDVSKEVGDFLVGTKSGLPSYQLAVVLDDLAQGVTQIVRGADLLPSTARQIRLYSILGHNPPASYTHLPLVVGPDGSRLAKRHGDTRLSWYRDWGVSPRRILGLLGRWSGLDHQGELGLDDWFEQFKLARLPKKPVVFTASEENWLRN